MVFPVLNDFKAKQLANTLKDWTLPEKTEIVEVISGCGNTGGTGNHTEIWAGMLIKTELAEKGIHSYFDLLNVQKVDESHKHTFIMDLLGTRFNRLADVSQYDGYYIVETIDKAVSSSFDLRGH